MTDLALPRKTFFSGFALPAISWGLPFHSLMVAVLFGALGFGADAVRMFAAWKEILVLGTVVFVIFRAMAGKGPGVTISWLDLAVGALFFIAFAFFVAGEAWLQIELPKGAGIYGLRDIVFFLLLYFVGRASPEIADDPDTLRRLYIITVMISAIAIVEWALVTPDMLVLLGVAAYFQDFLNVGAFTAGNDFGLPMNYWTTIGSVNVQRAGSVFLSSQAFAVPFLILMPAATAWFLGGVKRRTLSTWMEYGIIWLGLILSITRMTLIVCALQLLIVILLLRRPEWAVGSLSIGVASLLVAFLLVPGLPGFVWDTLTWQTSSSASHLKDWSKGLDALFTRPWGSGVGTTDQSAVRFGLEPLTADNGYLKYAVELGLQGLIAHVLIYLGLAFTGLKLARSATTETRRLLGIVVVATTVGVMINATTAVVFNSLLLPYLYFWFGGAAVTIAQRESVHQAVRASAPLELAPA
jgi:hypothetical protein